MRKVYLMFTLIIFIQSLIAQEDSYHNWIKAHLTTEYSIIGGQWVLTDKEIQQRMKSEYGVTLARRTINEYRKEMGIPPSFIRKRR